MKSQRSAAPKHKSTSHKATLVLVGLMALGITGAALTHSGTGATRGELAAGEVGDGGEEIPLEYLPTTHTVRLLSLGHHHALADLLWVRAVLYFARELSSLGAFEWLFEYIDLVVALDPDFVDIYKWGGAVTILKQNKVGIENVRAANRILDEGAHRFPNDWQLPLSAMGNCSFYVTPTSEAEREELDACRTKFLRMAAFRPGAPDYLPLLATQDLSERGGDMTQVCGMLLDAYMVHQSGDLRSQVQARLKGGMCGDMSPEDIKALDKAFKEAHEANYPYLPPDLFVHIYIDDATEAASPLVIDKKTESTP